MNNLEQPRSGNDKSIAPPPSPFDGINFDAIREGVLADRPFGGPKVASESHDFSTDTELNRVDAIVERREKDALAAKRLLNEIQISKKF